MRLKQLAKSVSESRGMLHQLNLRALRNYIKWTEEAELVKQVMEIDEAVLLRALWEAGLSSGLQEVVLEKLKRSK